MAPAHLGTLYYVEQTIYKAQKAMIAAKFNGVTMETKQFDVVKDAQNPEFQTKNPTGKVPFLETEYGSIFTSNAVARYVARVRADTSLYGQSLDDEGQIDTWLDFCTHELEVPMMTWVYPVLGLMEDIPQATTASRADVQKALSALEGQLKVSTFLVGDVVTLADIAIVCAIREGFARVCDAAFRKPYPKVCAWFERCCAMPQFKVVLGDVKLCTQAEKPKPFVAAAKDAKPAANDAKKVAAGDNKKAPVPATSAPKAGKKDAPPPPAAAPPAGGAVDEAAIKAKGDEIRVLKEKLKAEGITGKKLNDHEEVAKLVKELAALKAGAAPAGAPAAKPAAVAAAPAAATGDVEAAIKAKGDEIRALKDRLKGEGITGKKLNENEEVLKLVADLSALKAQMPAGGAPSSAPQGGAPKAAPKPKEAPKKEEKKKEEKPEKDEKPKKDDKKAEEPKAPTPEEEAAARKALLKKVIKEGGKRGVEIEGAADMGGLQFFCTSMDLPDGDVELLTESMKAMNAKSDPTEEERKGGSGHIGKMIFSAGVEQLAVVSYVPTDKQGELSCEEWLKAVLAIFGGQVSSVSKDICTGYVKANPDKGVFPLKIREPMILEANNFLRKKGLFPEDNGSDDDEMVFGDDDFPS